MKKLQRFQCVMLCIVMCLAMVLPTAASSNSVGTGSSEIAQIEDPITAVKGGYTRITFTDEYNGSLPEIIDNGDGTFSCKPKSDAADLEGAKYPYSVSSMHVSAGSCGKDYPGFVEYNGIQCLKPAAALISDYGGYGFVFKINFDHPDYDRTNRNYAVITYATEAEGAIEFRLPWGNPDSTTRQIGGTYTTDTGTWQSVSFPLAGLWKDNRDRLAFYSNDEFYICELILFENAADSEAYAAKAPAYFNGEEYSDPEEAIIDPINSVTAKSIRYTFTEDNIATSGFATIKSHGNGLEPGGSNATNNVFTYYNGGVSYVNAKGVPRGNPYNSGKNKWGMSIVFNNLGKSLTKNDDVYIVTTYLSNSESDHVIGIYPITYDKRIDIVQVTKNTEGWRASAPFRVKDVAALTSGTYAGQTFFERMTARELVVYTSAPDVDGLNLREMVFIADEAQAQAYATAATAYYNAIETFVSEPDPEEPTPDPDESETDPDESETDPDESETDPDESETDPDESESESDSESETTAPDDDEPVASKFLLTVDAPESAKAGDTVTVDIYAKSIEAKTLAAVNFTLTCDTGLTVKSITPVTAIGGESAFNAKTGAYGWKFFAENDGVALAADTAVMIATAEIVVGNLEEEATLNIGISTAEGVLLNAAFTDDELLKGFTPVVEGDKIDVEVTTVEFTFITADEYLALAADQQIAVVAVDTEKTNDTTYTLVYDAENSEVMYYSERYHAYVAIVDVNLEAEDLASIVTKEAKAAPEVNYDGDVNGDGRFTAGDAALISDLLHSYTLESKAADKPAYSDIIRLRADVLGVDGVYVTVADAMAALRRSVGLK